MLILCWKLCYKMAPKLPKYKNGIFKIEPDVDGSLCQKGKKLSQDMFNFFSSYTILSRFLRKNPGLTEGLSQKKLSIIWKKKGQQHHLRTMKILDKIKNSCIKLLCYKLSY